MLVLGEVDKEQQFCTNDAAGFSLRAGCADEQ